MAEAEAVDHHPSHHPVCPRELLSLVRHPDFCPRLHSIITVLNIDASMKVSPLAPVPFNIDLVFGLIISFAERSESNDI